MTKNKMITFLLIGSCLAALAGCSNNKSIAAQEQSAQNDALTDGSATVKPGASVTFTNNYDGRSEPGFVESFELSIHEAYTEGTLTVSLSTSEGLELVSNTLQESFSMQGNNTLIMNVDVRAQTPGRYYLNVLAKADTGSGYGNGQAMTRSHAVAINIGDPKLYPKKTQTNRIETTANGGKIIIMEAEETIQE